MVDDVKTFRLSEIKDRESQPVRCHVREDGKNKLP